MAELNPDDGMQPRRWINWWRLAVAPGVDPRVRRRAWRVLGPLWVAEIVLSVAVNLAVPTGSWVLAIVLIVLLVVSTAILIWWLKRRYPSA